MQIVDAEVPKSFRLDRVGVADPTTWNAKATCRGMQRLLQTLEELAGRTDRTVQQQAASLLKEGIRIPSTTRLEGFFGAIRYGRGHNIASLDSFEAAKAMRRLGDVMTARAVRQQRLHHASTALYFDRA